MSNPHARAQSLPVAPTTGPTCTSLRSMPVPMPAPGSVDELERIIAELLPTGIPTDLMSRRGKEAQRIWAELAASPLYEALTIWVMAAWPEQTLERVDTMVRTAIAAGHQVRDGRVVDQAADRRRRARPAAVRSIGRCTDTSAERSASSAMTPWSSSWWTNAPTAAGSFFAGAGRRRPL